MRKVTAIVLVLLLALAAPVSVLAQGTCATWRTYVSGDSVTASDLNSLQITLGQTNAEASCIDGMGDTTVQFNDALNPETGGAATLSTQLYHDVANLRYVVRHAMGFSQWWRHYEDINHGHRSVRMHYEVITDQFNPMWSGRGHYWGGNVRQHLVSYSVSSYSVGTMHPESVMFLLHVGAADGVGSYGSFATPSVRFKVGIGGDVHVGNTLMVHAAGTATHAAIFRAPSPGTGIYWPAVTSVGLTAGGGAGVVLHANAGLFTGLANSLDLGGAAGGGFRNAHFTGTLHAGGLIVAQGVTATPGIRGTAANSAADVGFLLADGSITLVIDAVDVGVINRTGATGFVIRSDAQYRISSGDLAAASDLGLAREGANLLSITNGSTGGGGLQFRSLAEPTCNATNRGALVSVQGGAGVADTFRICTKDAADAYAYRALF